MCFPRLDLLCRAHWAVQRLGLMLNHVINFAQWALVEQLQSVCLVKKKSFNLIRRVLFSSLTFV